MLNLFPAIKAHSGRTQHLHPLKNTASAIFLAGMMIFLWCILPAKHIFAATALTTVEVGSGFVDPIFVTSPPGDTARIFVVEQGGRIKIVENGSTLATPFLDIGSIISSGGERGLLGLAFHPQYSENGYFFINYTDTNGDSHIARCKVSSNPDIADQDSLTTILFVDQPFSNHNAGMLAFSPNDGYLYIGFGDGGDAGDPGNRAQDSTLLLGKMLRIDVTGTDTYTIPPDNPFAGSATVENEIWALGLRNPWRYSFDRETGDLYIADVGQSSWEEIDFQPAGDPGGNNYGWRLMEGTHCYNPPTNCDPGGLTNPIYEYDHSPECSITGGYVYRGCAIPDLQGTYFFADYCSDNIWSFRYDGANLTEFTNRTAELAPNGSGSFQGIASFGEDAFGELYIADRGLDAVYKIVPVDTIDCNSNGRIDNCDITLGISLDENQNGVPDECETPYICGNANGDSNVNVSDAVYIINYVFVGGDPPSPLASGDVNCDMTVNVSDAVYIINYVFVGGNAPCDTDGDGTADC